MLFRISDTFTDSLAKLTNEEQKQVKTTAFDLQMNPAQPGHQFHKLEKAKDKNFWSVRVSKDIRIIVHKTANNLLLCYTGHHDKAYEWASKRKIQIHPRTGAAQLIEIHESVQEVVIPSYVTDSKKEQPPLQKIDTAELLDYGIPEEWIDKVKSADADELLEIAAILPAEAAEAILNLAVGNKLAPPIFLAAGVDPFNHPDAQRRFRIMEDSEELAKALEYPWEKWAVFLHPNQQKIIEGNYNGPVRISGSAGTGKTIAALHRAVFLAKNNPDSRILLTTFSTTLAEALFSKLRLLICHKPRLGDQIEVKCLDEYIKVLHRLNSGESKILTFNHLFEIVRETLKEVPEIKFSNSFIIQEWHEIIDPWQIKTWEDYRDLKRLGRKKRLSEQQRLTVWKVLEIINKKIETKGFKSIARMYYEVRNKYKADNRLPFDYIIIDEAQDISVPQLRFLALFKKVNDNALFFTGDLGQRIFQQPFSWKSLGIDVQGRCFTLKVNYRTSHQIREQADLLLDTELADVDGIKENRSGTISVFNGEKPEIILNDSIKTEISMISRWIKKQIDAGIKLHEIGLIVRSESEIIRAVESVKQLNINYEILSDNFDYIENTISIVTMHKAKGLEFKSVVVMACDDEIIPSQERIEAVTDDSDLEEVYNTERHLLYVACTRARDYLLVSGVKPGSEFLEDLRI